MVRTHSIPIPGPIVFLVLVGLCLLYASLVHASDQPRWLEVHSPHFVVITDAGEKKGREVALRFEQMRAVFATLLTKERLNQPVPLTILALQDDKSYYQAAPLRRGRPIDVPGFFLPGDDQDFIVLNLAGSEPWRAVAHDFAHMLLSYNYPPAQEWFDEGVAQYFSSIRVDNKQVEIGSDPVPSLTELLGAQEWLSVADLFAMKHDGSASAENPHHTLFYAQSWIVMHYLLNQKKLAETGTYFDLSLNQHIPVEDALQKAFGVTPAQFEQTIKDYFHSQNAQANHSPVPVGPEDLAISSKPLPEADARAIYAEVQLRIPERREYGLKELLALTAASPQTAPAKPKVREEEQETEGQIPATANGNALAHRVLAWDYIERAKFEEAMTELSDAAVLNQHDTWLRYYLSVLKYRLAQATHADIQGLPNMIQDLRTVIEWYPEFADAYDLMAVARMEGGGSTAAMQAERAAMRLSPRNERYVYHQAQIYIAGKQWEAAKALLERLRTSADAKLAADAREKLEQVATERKYGIPVASGTAQPKLEAQKSPFDVLEQDAAKRASAAPGGQAGGVADKRVPRYIKGRLVGVDCSQAPLAVLSVASEGAVLKLRAPDYKSLLLIGADDFSCDWRDRPVTVNYKPGGLSDGDLVSLEVR